MVFARGTLAQFVPPGDAPSSEAKQFRDKVGGRLGLTNPGDSFVELGNFDNDFQVEPGEYPASADFSSSITTGTNELIGYLNQRTADCPRETHILGGYSQGADVVGWALQRTGWGGLNSTTRANIGYVALYGDIKFIGRYSYADNCFNPPWAKIDIPCSNQPVVGMFGMRWPYRPSDFAGRFGSWCDGGDHFCNTSGGLPYEGNHGWIYETMWIESSAELIAARSKWRRDQLNPQLPQSGGSSPVEENEVALPPPPETPPPVPWTFENLEGDVGAISPHNANVGRTPAAVEFNGQFYVFHYDATNGDLRYARTSPGWVFDILDGAGGPNGRTTSNVGQAPTAVVYNNQLHVFYYDAGDGNLRHATSSDGVYWNFENLDGDWGSVGHLDGNVGQTPAATVIWGSLQLFYYDAGRGNLRHAWLNGGTWSFENLEGDVGSISHYDTNIGVDPTVTVHGNTLQIFYTDVTAGNLRHAWVDGAGWHFENLDGDLGSVGGLDADVGGNPTAVVYSGNLHVFYYNRTHGNLRHMWSDPWSGWHDEDLDGSPTSLTGYDGDVGSMSTAVVVGNTLQLFVYEAGRGNLRHLHDDGTGWRWENLDGQGGSPAGRLNANVGLDPVATTFGGGLQLFYFDHDNGNLRHAMPQ